MQTGTQVVHKNDARAGAEFLLLLRKTLVRIIVSIV